jgi:Family of unknown function (DUF6353)
MQLIPPAVTRKVAMTALRANKNSPTLLFGAGLFGVLGSTVMACSATLKLEETLEEISDGLRDANLRYETRDRRGDSYSTSDRHKAVAVIYLGGVGQLVQLYGPAALVGMASVACLTKSHNILQERNLGLTAAYAAVDQAFKKYRENVVTSAGEESDRFLRYETEEIITLDEKGQESCVIRFDASQDPSMYAKIFDQMNPNWAEEAEYNYAWLRNKQEWFNHLLTMRGYLFLNEVYEGLGILPTETGNVVGWLLGNGDSYVDFGIFSGQGSVDFVNGREAAILLDFNVDGSILGLIDQIDAGKKRGFTPWQR